MVGGHRPVARARGPRAAAARARLLDRRDDRTADRRGDARLHPAADPAAEHHRRAVALLLGALFSAYVFMPKKRVLDYSLDPGQPGDAVPVQPVHRARRDPGQLRRLAAGCVPRAARGRLHSRVPATLLIALGAFFPVLTDSLNRAGSTELFQLGKFLGVVFLFAGFLVSVEVFREVRIPFTSIRLGTARRERAAPTRRGDPRGRHGGRNAEPRPRRRGGVPPLTRSRATDAAAPSRSANARRGRARRRSIRLAAAMLSPMDGPNGVPVEAPARGSRCCWSTTTRWSGAACTGSSSSWTTSRSSARPRTASARSSSSASSSRTSC